MFAPFCNKFGWLKTMTKKDGVNAFCLLSFFIIVRFTALSKRED